MLVGVCCSAWLALVLRGRCTRTGSLGVVSLGRRRSAADPAAAGAGACTPFDEPARHRRRAGPKYNRHYWQRDCAGFVEFFFGELLPEPHSSKLVEDARRLGPGHRPPRC